jgi:hypothetical protein
MKCRAPIFGTKHSLGTLILRCAGQSQKTTRVGWLKSFILPVSGRGANSFALDFGTKSEDNTGGMVGVIHSPKFGTEHKDSRGCWKCPGGGCKKVVVRRLIRSLSSIHASVISSDFSREWVVCRVTGKRAIDHIRKIFNLAKLIDHRSSTVDHEP